MLRDVHWTGGFVAVFKHFAQRGFEFILLPIIVHVRPSATAHKAISRTLTLGELMGNPGLCN